jgi:nitrite reductase/ring-hydroxylating ferredoxin subunit
LRALCRIEEIAAESGKEVMIQIAGNHRYIALFRRGDQVFAYLNTCPHQGRSLNWAPDEFLLDNCGRLVCPHHGACFELNNGLCVSGPCEGASLTPVEIELKDGNVLLLED